MTFKDELTEKVMCFRNTIKTEAITYFVNHLKKAMNIAAMRGRTRGSICLRSSFYEEEEEEEEEEDEDILFRLHRLLVKENEESIEMYKWLIKQAYKTGIFKDIYIHLNEENYELEFYWYIEETEE
jgi:hypothetical protein